MSLFLSRLCGGELAHTLKGDFNHFLSRLCGGEPNRVTLTHNLKFLSRLCGGERRRGRRGAQGEVSKPPMRR